MRLLMICLLATAAAVANAESPGMRVLRGHKAAATPAFSPDGRFLTTASDDKTIKIWDLATLRPIRTIQNPGEGPKRIAYSPDSSLLAGTADKQIIFWNSSGAKIRELRGSSAAALAIAFSPDGRILASGCDDMAVRIWDVTTGKSIRVMQIKDGNEKAEAIRSIVFTPDGSFLAVGSGDDAGRNGRVRIIGVSNATVLQKFEGPGGQQIAAVAFSPDGQLLASGTAAEGKLTLRRTDGWQVVQQWNGGGPLTSLAFSPAGNMIAAAIDREVILWDAASARKMRTLSGHEASVVAIAFSPDGTSLASGSVDGTTRLWRLE